MAGTTLAALSGSPGHDNVSTLSWKTPWCERPGTGFGATRHQPDAPRAASFQRANIVDPELLAADPEAVDCPGQGDGSLMTACNRHQRYGNGRAAQGCRESRDLTGKHRTSIDGEVLAAALVEDLQLDQGGDEIQAAVVESQADIVRAHRLRIVQLRRQIHPCEVERAATTDEREVADRHGNPVGGEDHVARVLARRLAILGTDRERRFERH